MATATLAAPASAPAPSAATDDHEHYEVVGGLRLETPRMGTYETDVANNLMGPLDNFVLGDSVGKALVEMLFRIDPAKNLQRRPDLAVVTYDRWPKGRPPSPGTSCPTWPPRSSAPRTPPPRSWRSSAIISAAGSGCRG